MDFFSYLLAAIQPSILIMMLAAVILGVILGALPGLSSTFACAVMLPVTFTMTPVAALLFLGAIYMGSTYGGAFAAILLNTPGTPQNIATTFDGFPMAKRGDGDLALSIACLASVFGGLVGIAAFIVLAPPLAQLALLFGPPEFFWLAIFGLTIIASLSKDNMTKGLLSGCIGLLLSLVGSAVVSGDTRFTFGVPALISGISIVPACIGLLCVPVVMDMALNAERYLSIKVDKGRNARLGEAINILWAGKRNLLRSSLLGTGIGILPAAGGAIASLVAYSTAMRSSKDPESFGKGNPDGVIASETANNATVGSGLIPTFVLGIPGTPTDAVILGAMLIHGLQIGPKLFTNHVDTLMTFIVGLTISTLLLIPVGLLLGRYIYAFALNTPKRLLAPTVALMTIIGSFSIYNSHADVVVMMTLGVFAWVIGRSGFPAAPIVLGLLLGPIAEEGFSQAVLIGGATNSTFSMFFGRGLSLAIIACIIVSLAAPAVVSMLNARKGTQNVVQG
jgi:putative tricarboxylic transport membrane protein